MSIAERIASTKAALESIKTNLRTLQREKEDEIDWATYGRPTTVSFSFQTRRTLLGHFGKVAALDWSSEPNSILSASQDGKLIVWNAQLETKKAIIPIKSPFLMACAFEKEGSRLTAGGGMDSICSINEIPPSGTAVSGRAPLELVGHEGYLSCCKFMGPNRMLTSSGDSTCMLWDISDGKSKKLQTYYDHSADVMSVSLNPTNMNVFTSSSCDSTVKVWDIRANACVQTFTGHRSDVNAVEFAPSGTYIGTGSDDATCRIFDIRSFGPVQLLQEDKIIAGVTDICFSSTGRLLFASYTEPFCRAWETISKEGVFHELKAHKYRVTSLGVNATGQALCSGSWDMSLSIWA